MALQYQGWAYVSCSAGSSGSGSSGTASAQGPTGSLQFHSGSSVSGGSGISGSANLLFLTASSQLILTGSFLVNGDITARNFDIINHTISYLSSSGDSKFGDTTEDIHQFTGSLYVSVSSSSPSIFAVSASGAQPSVGINTDTPHASFTLSGSYAVNYASTSGNYSVASTDYFVVTTVAGLVVTLPTATAQRGRLIVVKGGMASPNLTVSASVGQTIDGAQYQQLLSDFSSETYVSDGTSAWYII